MSEAFCPSCHTVNSSTARSCRLCSAKMEEAPAAGIVRYTQSNSDPNLSGAFRRTLSLIIDSIAMTLLVSVIAVFYLLMSVPADSWSDQDQLEGIGNIFGLVGAWLYFAGLESSQYLGTFGERIMGVMVTDEHGEPVTFLRASMRHVGRFVCGLTLGLGYLTVFFTKRRQGLHDLISGCIVVDYR